MLRPVLLVTFLRGFYRVGNALISFEALRNLDPMFELLRPL